MIDFENYSLEEIHGMDEETWVTEDMEDEGSVFDEILHNHREETK